MDINQVITGELGVKRWQVDAAVKLIDEGNTIPFIARYRKEVTGTLDDAQLRTLHERLMYLRNLEEKKEQVLASIEEQGKLTEELKKQILAAETMVVIEDLYDCKREGTGTACSTYHTSESGETDRSVCRRICESGERSKIRKGISCDRCRRCIR